MLLGKSLGLSPDLLASIINTSVRLPLERPFLLHAMLRIDCSGLPLVQTGRCWSSETNNPAPKATPSIPTPADRGYTGGFLSKLMSKGNELSFLMFLFRESPKDWRLMDTVRTQTGEQISDSHSRPPNKAAPLSLSASSRRLCTPASPLTTSSRTATLASSTST
jgi:hypothetical protein